MDVYFTVRVPAGRDPGDLFKHLVDNDYGFFVTKHVAEISKWKEGNADISARNEVAQNEPQEIVRLPMKAFVKQVNGEAVDAVMQENDEAAVADPQNGAPDDSAMGELVEAEPLFNAEIKIENNDMDQYENVNLPPQMNQIEADFSPANSLNGEEEVEERSHILEMMEKDAEKNQAEQTQQIKKKGQKKQEAKKDTAKDPNRAWCEDCQRSVGRRYFEAHRERMHKNLEKKINHKEAVAKKLEKAQKKKEIQKEKVAEEEGSTKQKKQKGKTCGDCGRAFTPGHYANHIHAFKDKPHFHCKPCNKSFLVGSHFKHRPYTFDTVPV